MTSYDPKRLERALKQRMYLLGSEKISENNWSFQVEGFTGNNYNVLFKKSGLKCTCPDSKKPHNICKHVYFIMVRILKERVELLQRNTNVFETFNDIDEKFSKILDNRIKDPLKSQESQEHFNILGKSCAICYEGYEDLEQGSEVLTKCPKCSNVFHLECMTIWLRRGSTCPLCRNPWSYIIHDEFAKFH